MMRRRDVSFARATRGLRRREGSGQVPFLLAERAHSESARSMRAVKGSPATPLKKGIESKGLEGPRPG